MNNVCIKFDPSLVLFRQEHADENGSQVVQVPKGATEQETGCSQLQVANEKENELTHVTMVAIEQENGGWSQLQVANEKENQMY